MILFPEKFFARIRSFTATGFLLAGWMCAGSAADHPVVPVPSPSGLLHLVPAPPVKFDGPIFLLNGWDGGDKDNQSVGEELNRNSRIKESIVILSDVPGRDP